VAAFSPAVDVFEDDQKLFLLAEIPGVIEKDLHVQIENNILSITGQRTLQHHAGKLRRLERSYGSFSRAFALPDTVDAESIHAVYENGVLRVTINHSAEAQAQGWHMSAHVEGEGRTAAARAGESKANVVHGAQHTFKATAS
jgi:HSP20 family protein